MLTVHTSSPALSDTPFTRPPPMNGTQSAESSAHFSSSHFTPLLPPLFSAPRPLPLPGRLMVLKMRARHMHRRNGRVRGLSRAGAGQKAQPLYKLRTMTHVLSMLAMLYCTLHCYYFKHMLLKTFLERLKTTADWSNDSSLVLNKLEDNKSFARTNQISQIKLHNQNFHGHSHLPSYCTLLFARSLILSCFGVYMWTDCTQADKNLAMGLAAHLSKALLPLVEQNSLHSGHGRATHGPSHMQVLAAYHLIHSAYSLLRAIILFFFGPVITASIMIQHSLILVMF